MAKSIPLTDFNNLKKLYIGRPQNRDPAKTYLHEIHALDTETWNGDIFLIADSDGRYLDKITPDSVIKFLFSKKFENTWNFFYNIECDAGVILKLLGNTLNIFKNTRKLDFLYKGYSINYIPKKVTENIKGTSL